MVNAYNLPDYFCAEAVNTACYMKNHVLTRQIEKKTPYELWHETKPNIGCFKAFGYKCFKVNDKDIYENLILLLMKVSPGFYTNKAFRVYNKTNLLVKEPMHVVFCEYKFCLRIVRIVWVLPLKETSPLTKSTKHHPKMQVIGDMQTGESTDLLF